jgi:hypothetical protein
MVSTGRSPTLPMLNIRHIMSAYALGTKLPVWLPHSHASIVYYDSSDDSSEDVGPSRGFGPLSLDAIISSDSVTLPDNDLRNS